MVGDEQSPTTHQLRREPMIKSIRRVVTVAATALALLASQVEAHSWYKVSWETPPPYHVRANFWESEVYQTGTVPVTLAPSVPYGDPYGIADGSLFTLLNHADSAGDY